MKYDYIVKSSEELKEARFHLSCGFHENTYILFEKAGFYVNIHCRGTFTFCTLDYQPLAVIRAKPMDSGRECYMDVLISTTEDGAVFCLPEYRWIDHYPHCDGESDRWSAEIIGVRDTVRFPAESVKAAPSEGSKPRPR